MTECCRISTRSRAAMSSAFRSGRTLNAMMMALDADASSTSDSFTAPTPEWMIRIFTFSSDSFVSVSASTSAEPCTSAAIVDERADAADDRSGDERVADAERAVLNEHRRHRTASLVQLRFEDRPGRTALRVRLELEDVADEEHHLEEQLDVLLLLRGHFNGDRLPAPF